MDMTSTGSTSPREVAAQATAPLGDGGDWVADGPWAVGRPSISVLRDTDTLEVWHDGMILAELCYQATQLFPPQLAYGLDAQIRMTASQIPASLAQSYEQSQVDGPGEDYEHCLERARGALLELKTHLKFSQRLSLVAEPVNALLLEECDFVDRRLQHLREAA